MRLGDFKYLFAVSGVRRLRGGDIGMRIFAVALAIGLWIFVNAGERGSVEPLTVPISYRSLPQGMVIVNHPPAFVKIEVTGPRTLLSLLDPERLTLRIDLRGVAAGQSEFKVYPAMFNMERNTAVTSISPDQLALDVDRLVTRDVPVHLAVQGKVEPGYTITSVDVTPPTVTIAGPSRFIAPLTSVSTEPFDLKGLTSGPAARLISWRPIRRWDSLRVMSMRGSMSRRRLPTVSFARSTWKSGAAASSTASNPNRRR